jgi:5-methylcytosine-specific restriction endonuclease McrA
VVPESNYLAHWQRHVDQTRDRKGSSGNWKNQRAMILRRDHYRCVICRASGPQVGGTASLEVHHRDRNWRNNEPWNLITVCDACHDAIQ